MAFGASIALAISGAACAQVSIISVARSTHAGVCVHVPPDNPNWCESYDASNATPGPWSSGGSFAPGAAGDFGHANAVTQAGQESEVYTNTFTVNCQTNAWVESGGSCSSQSVATASLVARFGVSSPTIATINGGITNIGGTASVIIDHAGGGSVSATSAPGFNTPITLQPGEYEFRSGTIANSE